jgi:hypothetical protein
MKKKNNKYKITYELQEKNLYTAVQIRNEKKLRFFNEKEKSLFYFDFNSLDYCWTLGSQMKKEKNFFKNLEINFER